MGITGMIPFQTLNSVTSWSGRVLNPPLRKPLKPRHVERMRNIPCVCLRRFFASLRMTEYAIKSVNWYD